MNVRYLALCLKAESVLSEGKKKKNVIFLIFLQVLQKLLLVLKAYFAYIKKSHPSTVFLKKKKKKEIRDLENYLMRVTDGDTLHYRIYNHTAE